MYEKILLIFSESQQPTLNLAHGGPSSQQFAVAGLLKNRVKPIVAKAVVVAAKAAVLSTMKTSFLLRIAMFMFRKFKFT